MDLIISIILLIAGLVIGGDVGLKLLMISGIFSIAESIYDVAKAIEKK